VWVDGIDALLAGDHDSTEANAFKYAFAEVLRLLGETLRKK